ncbi:MAG: hypothetical protein ABI321_04425 [Polyangia bacterium]
MKIYRIDEPTQRGHTHLAMKSSRELGVAFVLLAVLLPACRGQSMAIVGDMMCPSDSTSCAGAAPSYASDVAPLIESNCSGCHMAGGSAADRPLTSYDALFKLKGSAFTAVYGCVMPPADDAVDQLTPDQRTTLIQWLACGAPNN